MFAECMFRSGRLPRLVRSDRGPEFKNQIMQEYMAVISIGRRLGTPWRPREQGLVEGAHKITQTIMGIMIGDVMRAAGNDTGELQYLVEFIVYNTPGGHGFTPRDMDRRWSLATPLERELQPFQVGELEPLSEYVAALYRNYRTIRAHVLEYMSMTAEKRAELVNRYRRPKDVKIGSRVCIRDPRHRKAGGRTPHKKPLPEPVEVVEKSGSKIKCKKADGTLIEDIHLEDVLVVPQDAQDYEREDIRLGPDDDPLLIQDPDPRRSPGMMIEDAARQDKEDMQPQVKKGKMDYLMTGAILAYKAEQGKPTDVFKSPCRLGKISVSYTHLRAHET